MTSPLRSAARAAFPDPTVESLTERDTRPGNATALLRFADGKRAYPKFKGVPGRVTDVLRDARSLLDGAAARAPERPTGGKPGGGAPCALLHGDAARPNVHVDPPGLLGWERALVGDPALDLVDTVSNNFDQPDVRDEESRRSATRSTTATARSRATSPTVSTHAARFTGCSPTCSSRRRSTTGRPAQTRRTTNSRRTCARNSTAASPPRGT